MWKEFWIRRRRNALRKRFWKEQASLSRSTQRAIEIEIENDRERRFLFVQPSPYIIGRDSGGWWRLRRVVDFEQALFVISAIALIVVVGITALIVAGLKADNYPLAANGAGALTSALRLYVVALVVMLARLVVVFVRDMKQNDLAWMAE